MNYSIAKKSLNSKKINQTGGELVCPSNISNSSAGTILDIVNQVLNLDPTSSQAKSLIEEKIKEIPKDDTPYTFALESNISGNNEANKNAFIEIVKSKDDKTFTQTELIDNLLKILNPEKPLSNEEKIDDVKTELAGGAKKKKVYKKSYKKASKKTSKKTSKKNSKKISKKLKGGAKRKSSKNPSKKASKKTSKKNSKKTSKIASKRNSKTMKGGKKASKKTSKKSSKKTSKNTSKKNSKRNTKTKRSKTSKK